MNYNLASLTDKIMREMSELNSQKLKSTSPKDKQ